MGCGAGKRQDATDPAKKEEKKVAETKKEEHADTQNKCILIIGAPASGKGTQAEKIKAKYNFL